MQIVILDTGLFLKMTDRKKPHGQVIRYIIFNQLEANSIKLNGNGKQKTIKQDRDHPKEGHQV